ncbi:MAG: DUF3052 family protein [Chloroflexi bacterium]|nr:DUF3052 family protein [Chloroflexota bacterium]
MTKPAGYSGTPLIKKLGIKPGFTVTTLNAPSHYWNLLGPLPDGVRNIALTDGPLDVVHLFVTQRADLVTQLEEAKPQVKQNGMVWVSWPKKASKVPTDVTEDVVREVALAAGLVDVKVCAVDEVWSGLKLVRRLKDRT